MKQAAQKGLRSGAVFAILIVFMGLIGFTVTGPTLLAKLLGNPPKPEQMPTTGSLALFLALVGMWCGAQAAAPERHSGPGSVKTAFVAGAVAGALTGGVATAYAFIVGSVDARGIDLRPYLAEVSPDAVKLFLFQWGLPAGALAHFGLLLVSSVVGALVGHALRAIQAVRGALTRLSSMVGGLAVQVRRFPYAIYIFYIVLGVLLFLMPQVWGSYWNYIIGTVGLYVILGLGLNIVVGMAGQLVLGYVAFFAIGAYTMALLTAPAPHHLAWNFWLVILLAVLFSALTGILLGLPILRLRGDYLAIVTLGFGEIIRIMLRSDLMTPITAGPKGVRDVMQPSLFGISLASDINFLYLILVFVVVFIFITGRLQNSRTGRAWVAIREDEIAARASGINTFQSKLLSLAIGAAFAGLAGALFASRNQFTGPEDHSLMVSINVLALVIVGGLNSIPGIVLGSFALKGLPEILRELEDYRLLVFGALLVVMMILRPEGLWPGTRPNLEKRAPGEKPASEQAPSSAKTPSSAGGERD